VSLRIVWVKIGGLWPPTSGGRLRSFHTLAELSKRHRVTLLTTHDTGDRPEEQARALAGCERVQSFLHPIPKRGTAGFAAALARSWASPLPVDLWRCRVPALERELKALLASGSVDLCVADFLAAAPNVPLGTPVATLLFAHNVEHLIWRRLSRTERRPWRRLPLEVEWRKMRSYEAQVCAGVDATITVSETDRRILAGLAPGSRMWSVPTGVDVEYFKPNGTHEVPGRLVFTGSMDWYPNEDAILHFCEAVWPAIRRQVPEASLTVAGRNPGTRLRAAAAAAGVHLTGTVDDIRPDLAQGQVYVVPLRVGSGTRLKIFEALSMGKPVVATRVGAEGLPLSPGEHYIQADEPDDFAQAVVSLLRDSERRRALATAGRRLVEERFSWAQVARRFETLCEHVVTNHAR
jgi:sugar transferase (PEP-CTERM/EpsH1 system associated)